MKTNVGTYAAGGVALAIGVAATGAAADGNGGRYLTGDFHNHTTCSDGSTSITALIDAASLTYGLDWFVQSGHGGSYPRDCRISDPEYDGPYSGEGNYWVNTIGAAALKGDPTTTDFTVVQGVPPAPGVTCAGPDNTACTVPAMWRWQMIQEFNYPIIEAEARRIGKPVLQGLETIVPGHEHASTSVIAGQVPPHGTGNADGVAQFEYCFDRADDDTSRGVQNQWDCSVPSSPGNANIDPTARKILNTAGTLPGGHPKAVESVKWMSELYPDASYYVPAHVERAGAFNPTGNNGWNVEHFRDVNNAAPDIAFGFESQPGHQAVGGRGGYGSGAVGGGTYGGTGIYAAQVGGLWDAMLGEGRHWWLFASSDWHSRGSFGPFEKPTTSDFFPGEYQKDYVAVESASRSFKHELLDGMRSGNSWVVQGDLIDKLVFVACAEDERKGKHEKTRCVGMGETLSVHPGQTVEVHIEVNDPWGSNHSSYTFDNPELLQLGIHQPLDQPEVHHFDLIGGMVGSKIDPADPAYTSPTNATTRILGTFNETNWWSKGTVRRATYKVRDVTQSQYLRLRGTNLPYATPNATDVQGNPLLDTNADNIPCTDAACPAHLKIVNGQKAVDVDVEAWSNLWFYSNPIFIRVAR